MDENCCDCCDCGESNAAPTPEDVVKVILSQINTEVSKSSPNPNTLDALIRAYSVLTAG